MMSHPFNRGPGQGRPPSQDFIMINNNNNYLPGVSRLSEGFQMSYPPLGPQSCGVPLVTCGPCGVFTTTPSLATQAARQNYADKMTINVDNSDLDLTGNVSTNTIGSPEDLSDTLAGTTEVEMNPPPDLCEHQGPLNSNISQNPGWSAASYPIGALNTQSSASNFTFTTPTQSYLYSPALTATTQNRFHNARLRPQTFAPGCNAQWKHSIPRKMPWLLHSSVTCPQGLSVFTGTQSSSVCSISQQAQKMTGTNTLYSPQMYQPVASCSQLTRRHKRRHTVDTVGEECLSNKIHLTEDKIARHMRDLRIHNISPPPGSVISTGDGYNASSQGEMLSLVGDAMSDTCYPGPTNHNTCNNEPLRHSQRQWHDFKLLEEKLQMIDEDTASDNEDSSKQEPVLRIVDGINIAPKTVLPQHIVDKIRNPCQEVVLWSPQVLPGKMDEPITDDNVMMEAQGCEDRGVYEDSGMETDLGDEDL